MKNLLLKTSFIFFVLVQPLWAAVSLSIVPLDGTNEIRLKQGLSGINVSKSVRIRVTSTDGHRYQVSQRVVEPLVNEKGEMIDMSGLQTATEYNSNTSGTLYLQSPEALSMGDQLLYTSGQGGDSDSFVVAYSVRPDRGGAAGNSFSKIMYLVRSVDNSAQDQQMISLMLESQNTWKADVVGLRSPSRVSVKDTDKELDSSDGIKISFAGGDGNDVRIYQEVPVVPQDQRAQELKSGILLFMVASTDPSSSASGQGTLLDRPRDLIYSGRAAQNDLVIRFLPVTEKVSEQDAGDYAGQLKYAIETTQGRQEFTVDLEFHVQPVFMMEASMPPEGVSFNNVIATNAPEDKVVTLTVRTNLHKPYQVTQAFSSPLTNEKGKEIDKDHFLVKVDVPAGQKGKTKFVEFSPMEVGEYPVYSSDGQGSPATFKVLYRLQAYSQMNAGNFLAPIRFSLDQN